MSESDSSSNFEDFSDLDPDYRPSTDECTSNTNFGFQPQQNSDSDDCSVEENIAQSLPLFSGEIDVIEEEVISTDQNENNTAQQENFDCNLDHTYHKNIEDKRNDSGKK